MFLPALILAVTVSGSAFAVGPQYHTVTYSENDNITDPVFALQTENAPSDLSAFVSFSPRFTYAGHIFVDWNTQPDGTGTTYLDGATYDFGAALDLYAVWASEYHTVTFAENDNVTDNVEALQTENEPTALASFSNLSPGFFYSGHTFVDWNTQPNGTGTTYLDGATYDFGAASILYAIWIVTPTVTASFDAHSGTGFISSISDPVGTSVLLPTSSGFSNSGYTFGSWNTASDGGGTSYSQGASFILDSDQVFYAQWIAMPLITLSFESNGGNGSLTSLSGLVSAVVTLPGLSSVTQSGDTLTSWNTASNGSGVSYSLGQSVTLSTSLTLFAQWTPVPIPVIALNFQFNGGSGSSTLSSGLLGTAVALPGPSSVTQSGFTLTSWNTAANGSGVSYSPGQSVTLSTSLTLFAQWTPVPDVVLSFDANGGTGSLSTMSGLPGATVAMPGPSSLVKTGYGLVSWNTAANGTGESYSLGQSVTLASSFTLYAQWKSLPAVVLHFVSDGGSGSLTSLSGLAGATVALPGSSSLVKSGYTLRSWNTAANGSGTSYALGQSVTLSTSLTLYARWTGTPTEELYGAVGLFARNSTELTAAMKAQVRQLAETIKAKEYKKVTLYGYTAETGLASLDMSLSSTRATRVANYLREQLSALKVTGVTISAAGEGAIAKMTASQYSRVEVFVV